MSDIQIPLIANLVSTGMVTAFTVAGTLLIRFSDPIRDPLWLYHVQVWIGHKWYLVTLAAGFATMAGLWFKRQLPDLVPQGFFFLPQLGQTLLAVAERLQLGPGLLAKLENFLD